MAYKRRDDHFSDRRRRKVCAFCADQSRTIDYKEVSRLRRYVSERAKIEPGEDGHLRPAPARAGGGAQARPPRRLLPYAPQHMRP
jgi:ribosomal protein S18